MVCLISLIFVLLTLIFLDVIIAQEYASFAPQYALAFSQLINFSRFYPFELEAKASILNHQLHVNQVWLLNFQGAYHR